MTTNTVHADGLVIETAWDEYYAEPVELRITIDPKIPRPAGKGIPQRVIHHLSLQSMMPDTMRTVGSLRVVGDWLEKNKPGFRCRPAEPSVFYAHVALFHVLAVEAGEQGINQVLANYAAVRPSKAREWIETSRRLGMLTENDSRSRAGRACGILTDKARAILATESVSQSAA